MSTRVGRWSAIAIAAMVAVGCGGGRDDPRCVARQTLRDAVRAIDQAEINERAGDRAAVRQRIDEGERLIRAARRNLSRGAATSIERSMLEAAEYLDFVVGSYRETGDVDGTLTQFATRELNRAPAPGEAPLAC